MKKYFWRKRKKYQWRRAMVEADWNIEIKL